MTKLFKNSKQILAFVFAFAVLAVSLFTGSINIDADACDVSKIDYWDGTKASSFASGDGSETSPYIIKTAEQLAYCCLGQDPTTSKDKFYKVDDSVKVFVMQPQNVVDLDTLLALDSAEAVKTYLTGLTGVKNWQSQFNKKSFNGNFDGNGATIYGLYADGVAANVDDVGLFPQYDGGYVDGSGNVVANTCKNIAIKNSYFNSRRRMGAISGASYGKGYGADVNGIVHYDTIAIINCYMTAIGNVNYYGEQGIVVDGGAGDVSTVNNLLVKGTYAYNTEQGKNIGIVAAGSATPIKDSNGVAVENKLSNSIILGSDPFRREYYSNLVFQNKSVGGATVRTFFENVITDQEAGKVVVTNPAGWGSSTTTAEFAEEWVKQITATGFDFQAAATTLDWEKTWFMSENGPELRKFHGEISLKQTETTHVWECEDCGLQSPGGEAEHNFVCENEIIGDGNDVFTCSVCDYTCKHNKQTDAKYDPGDCVTASGVYSRCEFCDWYIVTNQGEAPGHDFTYVPAYAGNCEEEGHEEYWFCEVCKNKFASDNVNAPMDTAVSDAELSTGLGGHIKDTDEEGIVVMHDENGHWYICKVDGGRLDYDSNAIGDDEVVEHEYENAVCKDCGYECKLHNFKATGKVAVSGDCFTDEELEVKCEICGFKDTVVSVKAGHKIIKVEEVAANDRMEGTKAHYKCSECKTTYGDAEGKTPVTKASLVIPKVLPAEYQNTITAPENADASNKSPATSDSFASVLAVAALAGVAFVALRKVR